jgi:hypothetical protein
VSARGTAISWRKAASGSVGAAIWPFVVSRVLVIATLALARLIVTDVHVKSKTAISASHAGLLGWDASWYRRIAEVGYSGAGRQSLRFFPLLPWLAKGVATLPGIDDGAGLLLVSNAAAFVALALVHRIVAFETGDEDAAQRAPWLLALFPAAFVLVMGYAESLLLVAALITFLCLRTRHFAWAGVAALAAGTSRPVGLLLAVPAAVEAVNGWNGAKMKERAARVGAVIGAPVGAAAYLVMSFAYEGSFLLPFREQVSAQNRGGIADPVVTIGNDTRDLLHGVHLGTALHAPWAIVLILLVVVLFRSWPLSYAAYASVTLLVALTAPNLTSLERYGLGCFPFALAITTLTGRRRVHWAVLAASSALLVAYGLLAFLGVYVP